jgi:hypothetical protein
MKHRINMITNVIDLLEPFSRPIFFTEKLQGGPHSGQNILKNQKSLAKYNNTLQKPTEENKMRTRRQQIKTTTSSTIVQLKVVALASIARTAAVLER